MIFYKKSERFMPTMFVQTMQLAKSEYDKLPEIREGENGIEGMTYRDPTLGDHIIVCLHTRNGVQYVEQPVEFV